MGKKELAERSASTESHAIDFLSKRVLVLAYHPSMNQNSPSISPASNVLSRSFPTASDLDCIRALFNEKEKELSLAVAKVEELTRQLEELRGRQNAAGTGTGSGGAGGVGGGGVGGPGGGHLPTPASAELEKLRRELMVSTLLLRFPFLRFARLRCMGAP